MKHVVVWDPSGEYWEGAIVEQELVPSLVDRGVAVLPAAPELFMQIGFAGYAKRSWGAGWPLDSEIPMAVTPLAIYYPGEPYRTLHWKARLVGKKGQGIPLRMAAAEARGNVVRPVLHDFAGKENAVDIANLPEEDEHGGWTVGGVTRLSVAGPSMFSLCLYGCAPGMRIAWVAATLTG